MARHLTRQSVPSFTGELITPGDNQYDQARMVWNAAVDRHPALIACAHRGRRTGIDLGGAGRRHPEAGAGDHGRGLQCRWVAGMPLGGGIGQLDRLVGLSCDNLAEATLVTADGSVLTASETDHPGLFWALRGGGNFGVVTSLSFRLHPVAEAYGGILGYPADRAADVLSAYAYFSERAPDNLGSA